MSPLPGWMGQAAVLQRTPASELDVYTIASIFPKRIKEIKPTLEPSEYIIEPGSFERPSVLVVTSAVSWIKYSAETEAAEQTFKAILVADSVIKDYSNGLIGANEGQGPGLFYVPGRKTAPEILKENRAELLLAREKQNKWYATLVTAADSLWARSNGNPVAIPTDSRLAAQELGLKGKPWMQDFNTLQMVACKNCGNLRNPAFPTCPSCRVVVDPELFKKLGLDKVQGA